MRNRVVYKESFEFSSAVAIEIAFEKLFGEGFEKRSLFIDDHSLV